MDKTNTPLQTALLYFAAISFAFMPLKDLIEARAWGLGLLLIPMVGLVLPPVRNWILSKTGRLPGVGVSIGISFVLLLVQSAYVVDGIEAQRKAKEAQQQKEIAERAAKVRSQKLDEYTRDKTTILAQIETLLSGNKSGEALALANKYLSVTKDPDLGRLQYRAELTAMREEWQSKGSTLPLERKVQVLEVLSKAEPSNTEYTGELTRLGPELERMKADKLALAKGAAIVEANRKFLSGVDSSHRIVDPILKASQKNPSSYEHIRTTLEPGYNVAIVTVYYRGTNSFNAVVTEAKSFQVDEQGNLVH